MPQYTEDDLNEAINAIQNGASIRQASKDWGIPKSTLSNRIKGSQPKGVYERHGQQKLSIEQEDHLSKWILTQEALGLPVTHTQIRLFANRVLKASGSNQTIGRNWVQKLIHRHPELKTKRGRSTDAQRIGATSNIIHERFKIPSVPSIPSNMSSSPLSVLPSSPLVTPFGDVRTPRRSQEVRKLVFENSVIRGAANRDMVARQFFNKVATGLDRESLLLADQERQIRSLEEEVERLRLKKRKKVEAQDLNGKFVRTEEIIKTRETLAKAVEASQPSENPNFEEMCTEWSIFDV